MQAQQILADLKAKLQAAADRNKDGRVDVRDAHLLADLAFDKALDQAQAHPKLALIVTNIVSIGITSMLWAIFCRH
jgi:hypothetical protein